MLNHPLLEPVVQCLGALTIIYVMPAPPLWQLALSMICAGYLLILLRQWFL